MLFFCLLVLLPIIDYESQEETDRDKNVIN